MISVMQAAGRGGQWGYSGGEKTTNYDPNDERSGGTASLRSAIFRPGL